MRQKSSVNTPFQYGAKYLFYIYFIRERNQFCVKRKHSQIISICKQVYNQETWKIQSENYLILEILCSEKQVIKLTHVHQ